MPNGEAKSVATAEFKCTGCGAVLKYDPRERQLKCDYCGALNQIAAEATGVVEHDFRELDRAPENTGFGLETHSLKCSRCGATTTIPAGVVGTKCAFCGSDVVVETPSREDLIRPETLIPFQIDKENAVGRFRQWTSKLWFRPNDLKRISRLADLTGMYTPFWTFDCQADSDWTAEAGYYYYETETYTDYEEGKPVTKTREVQKTRWEPAWGSHSDFYDDTLICASQGLERGLVDAISPFDLTKLAPYRSEYLSGWSAEEYSISPRAGWDMAAEVVQERERSACAAEVPGDTHRNLHVNTRLSSITYKHCLLPIWIAAYRYKEKAYRFLVNGQTGEVQGEAPLSWIKVTLAALAVAAVIAAIWYFTHR